MCRRAGRGGAGVWSARSGGGIAAAEVRLPADAASQRPHRDPQSGPVDADRATCSSGTTSARRTRSPGRTGFAHFFEHLMFKGSKNVEPEQHTSIVASVGGQANAYTNEDTTVFWQTVPAHYLPLVLWMEADRMATLRIEQETFVREREVVKEERRMRIENQPYGRLNEIIYEQAFTMHPYRHPVIGSMEDLNAATLADVRDFYATYYVPVERHGRDLRRLRRRGGHQPGEPVPRPRAEGRRSRCPATSHGAEAGEGEARDRSKSRAAARRRRRATTSPTTGIPTPIRCTSWRRCCRTARARASTASWSTSRGWRSPRSGRRTSSSTRTCSTRWRIVNPGQSPAAVEKALIAELDRMKAEGVTPAGAAARRRTSSRATTSSGARPSSRRRRTWPTPRCCTPTSPPRTASSTSSRTSPRRTCSAWRRPTSRPRAASSSTSCRRARAPHRGPEVRPVKSRRGLALRGSARRGPGRQSAAAASLATGVPAAAARSRARSRSRRSRSRSCPTGCTVVLVSQNEQPAVSVRLIVRAGAAQDPKGKLGLAMLTATLLDQGAGNRTAEQIADDDRLHRRHPRHRRGHRPELHQHGR